PNVAAIDQPLRLQPSLELSDSAGRLGIGFSCAHEHADAPHPLTLLRACRERPRGCRAAEERDEGAAAPNQYMLGLNGLSGPIFNHAGHYVGAVGIGGSIQHIPASPPQEQITAVTNTAQRISRKLGWSGR